MHSYNMYIAAVSTSKHPGVTKFTQKKKNEAHFAVFNFNVPYVIDWLKTKKLKTICLQTSHDTKKQNKLSKKGTKLQGWIEKPT